MHVVEKTPLTVVYAASKSFLPYLRLSLNSLPSNVLALVGFMGEEKQVMNGFPRHAEFLHIPESRNFNKSKALNAVIEQVRTPRVMIADADMIFPRFLFSVLEQSHRAEANIVYRFYIARFSEHHTNRVLAGADPWNVTLYSGWRDDDKGDDGPLPEGGDILRMFAAINPCVYDTEFLGELHGYDESFEKWGGADEELTRRGRQRGAQELRLPIVIGHLYHKVFHDFTLP